MSYSFKHVYIFKGQLQISVCFPLMCYLMGKIIMNQIGINFINTYMYTKNDITMCLQEMVARQYTGTFYFLIYDVMDNVVPWLRFVLLSGWVFRCHLLDAAGFWSCSRINMGVVATEGIFWIASVSDQRSLWNFVNLSNNMTWQCYGIFVFHVFW